MSSPTSMKNRCHILIEGKIFFAVLIRYYTKAVIIVKISVMQLQLFSFFKKKFLSLDFSNLNMIFFYNERKSVLSFESFSNALKCKPVQDFLVPFYPNPLCDWVNALAIFKLPLFPICRDGLLSFL